MLLTSRTENGITDIKQYAETIVRRYALEHTDAPNAITVILRTSFISMFICYGQTEI
jgi:hypothetical protein